MAVERDWNGSMEVRFGTVVLRWAGLDGWVACSLPTIVAEERVVVAVLEGEAVSVFVLNERGREAESICAPAFEKGIGASFGGPVPLKGSA